MKFGVSASGCKAFVDVSIVQLLRLYRVGSLTVCGHVYTTAKDILWSSRLGGLLCKTSSIKHTCREAILGLVAAVFDAGFLVHDPGSVYTKSFAVNRYH